MKTFPWISLGLAVICCLLFLLGDFQALHISTQSADRYAPWQWISGHLIHVDANHLIWNLAGLVLLGSWLEQFNRWHLVGALAAGMISINFWLVSPASNLNNYAGLSGVLNTLLVVLLWHLWRQRRSKLVLVTGVLSFAKILFEITADSAIFSQTLWPPVPFAHLAGFIAGVTLIVCLLATTDNNRSCTNVYDS